MKKIISFLIALFMIFTLLCTTGCGSLAYMSEEALGSLFDSLFEKMFGISGDNYGDEERGAFIESIGGVSETYKGSVSKESYDTAEDAAKAFVTAEIIGNNQAVVLDTSTLGELSEGEIKALNIPDDIKEGAISVEELSVTYMIDNPAAYVLSTDDAVPADTLNESKTVCVYVIKFETYWKYYSPAPITGDTITKSYYDSVFNMEKYKNCTLYSTASAICTQICVEDGVTEEETVMLSVSELIKYADGKVYIEQTVSATFDGESTTEAIYGYLETVGDEIVCYVKLGADSTEWYRSEIHAIGFSSLDELIPFYDQYLDYTYFTKTDYGFQLSGDNAKQYLEETFELLDISMFDDMTIDMFAEYYVSNGVLSGMRSNFNIEGAEWIDGDRYEAYVETETTTTCTNYGTTVVEKPFAD